MDFFGLGVDTLFAIHPGVLPDPRTILRTTVIVRALPANPAKLDLNREKPAREGPTGRQEAYEIQVYDDPSWNTMR